MVRGLNNIGGGANTYGMEGPSGDGGGSEPEDRYSMYHTSWCDPAEYDTTVGHDIERGNETDDYELMRHNQRETNINDYNTSIRMSVWRNGNSTIDCVMHSDGRVTDMRHRIAQAIDIPVECQQLIVMKNAVEITRECEPLYTIDEIFRNGATEADVDGGRQKDGPAQPNKAADGNHCQDQMGGTSQQAQTR